VYDVHTSLEKKFSIVVLAGLVFFWTSLSPRQTRPLLPPAYFKGTVFLKNITYLCPCFVHSFSKHVISCKRCMDLC